MKTFPSAALFLLLTVARSAAAAPDDWKSYLCRYTIQGMVSEHTLLAKVNEKDARVKIDDRDVSGVKIGDKRIHFEERGAPIDIDKATGKLHVLKFTSIGAQIGEGSCRVVDD